MAIHGVLKNNTYYHLLSFHFISSFKSYQKYNKTFNTKEREFNAAEQNRKQDATEYSILFSKMKQCKSKEPLSVQDAEICLKNLP